MTTANHRMPDLDPLQREAVGWVQKLLSGQATTADAETLRRWCARSPAHAAAFARASRVWGAVGGAGRLLGRDAVPSLARFAAPRRGIDRRALLGGGLATAAAAYAVVHPPLHLWPSLSELNADYRTATGEQRSLALGGDLAVRLNTQTSIAVQSSDGDTDRLELIAGQASFATPPLGRRVLMVAAASGNVVTSGARFDIRRLGDGGLVCVTCIEGDVQVACRRQTVTLHPGQQARYEAAGVGQVTAVDADIVSAWQRGIVVFRETPLAEVVEEINRYRPGRIILVNAELGRKPVSGRFRTDQMGEILTRLDAAFDARIRTLPGGIVLLS